MRLMNLLTPHLQLNSILELNPETVWPRGILGLLVDMDCTLKEHYSNYFRAEIVEWICRMHSAQIQLCVLSNGRSHRVRPLAQKLGLDCVADSRKPLTFGIDAAIAKMKLDRSEVAIVGDQIFSEVLGGRLAGIYTILVRPYEAKEPWYTRIKRPLERLVLRAVANRGADR